MTTTETPQLDTPQAMMDFFAHLGLPLPEELSGQSVSDTNTILAHFGIEDSEIVAVGPDGKPITGPYREDYGMKGMKWGVRKRAVTAGRSSSSPDKTKSGPPKKPARPSAKTMSNDELSTVIRRLQLEAQYNQLTATKKSPAKQFIQDILVNAGKSTVQNYANQYLNAAVGSVLNKAGVPSAASITQAAQKAAEEARKAAWAAT